MPSLAAELESTVRAQLAALQHQERPFAVPPATVLFLGLVGGVLAARVAGLLGH